MILAIDTASTLCAACVWDADAGRELGRCVEDIGKGHAERLMGVIDAALAQAGIAYADITAIAVSVGPGSFTGIRVGVSAARGLALALNVPAHGVTTLSAIAETARQEFPDRRIVAAIDAKRDELYVEDHAPDGELKAGPMIVPHVEAGALQRDPSPVLAGSGGGILAAALGVDSRDIAEPDATTADIAVYARLAAVGRIANSPPSPLYLRGPDAKPQGSFALPRKAGG